MHAFSALLALVGPASFALAVSSQSQANGCPMNRLKIVQTGTCTTISSCPYTPQTLADGTSVRGSYNNGNGYCVECPPGAWACNAQGPTNCYGNYSLFGGQCIANEQCLSQGNNFLLAQNATGTARPPSPYLSCMPCNPGQSVLGNANKCDNCPSSLGRAKHCTTTKALSCLSGYVLYQDKCLDTKCPSGWFNDNGVCKTCVSQDPKSVTCELGKSLTCTKNQLLIESTNRCGTSVCPYYPANGLPGSYRVGTTCKSCQIEAYNCNATGALNCYDPNGTQSYRTLDEAGKGVCISAAQCLASDERAWLRTQDQPKQEVVYGECKICPSNKKLNADRTACIY